MSRRRLLLSLALFAIASLSAVSAQLRAADEAPLRVLFIGNSYTAVNKLPAMLAELAADAGGRQVVVGASLRGGYTLEKHWELTASREQIESGKWDIVVLQEQSLRPAVDPKKMHEFARLLAAEAKQQGAEVVFYLTWARQHRPEMQAELNAGYRQIAAELGAGVAPVGPAWALALQDDPKLSLHTADKSHPTKAGTYLAACVFYATLLKKDPAGLSGKPGGLSDAQAARLQRFAWQAVEAERKLADKQGKPDPANK